MENVAVEAAYSVLDTFPPADVWTAPGYDQSSGSVEDDSSARDTLPDCLANKSPVSLLQELCMKRGLTAHYELIESEGPVHQRMFTYCGTAGSFTANGTGSSKKRARHAAATLIIAEMLKLGELSDQSQLQTSDENHDHLLASTSDQTGPPLSGGNPVGKLQEMTQKKYMAPPAYTFQDDGRPPHEREYTCTVKLLQYSSTACARTKKQAKRQVASLLLERLSEDTDLLVYSCKNHESSAAASDRSRETVSPMKMPRQSAYSMLRDGKTDSSISSSIAQSLKPKQPVMQSSDISYSQILQEIADVHKFSVTFVDVMEPSATGQQQCFVQLSTMPVILCRGVGRTKAEARIVAARDALRCMTHVIIS